MCEDNKFCIIVVFERHTGNGNAGFAYYIVMKLIIYLVPIIHMFIQLKEVYALF